MELSSPVASLVPSLVLNAVVTFGGSIVDAILAGERDPSVLAKLRNERIKASEKVIAKSLVGDYRPEHLFTLRQSLVAYRSYQKLIDDCDRAIRRSLEEFKPPRQPGASAGKSLKPPSKTPSPEGVLRAELQRAFGIDLTKIPGIRVGIAQALFGEIGHAFSQAWRNLSGPMERSKPKPS